MFHTCTIITDTDDQTLDELDGDLGRVSEPCLENINDADSSASVDSDATYANIEKYVSSNKITIMKWK